MITKFVESYGCVPEVQNMTTLKKKIIKLANGTTRIVYDTEGREKTYCRYCGKKFDVCNCTRTEHVYNSDLGCCDLCYEPFQPNGTGPANNKILHFFINAISWFNRWVSPISDKHDIGYFEGFRVCHKEFHDEKMLDDTKEKIRKAWWLKPKSFWFKRAKLNYGAVDKFGDSSFNWSGCVLPENIAKETKKEV